MAQGQPGTKFMATIHTIVGDYSGLATTVPAALKKAMHDASEVLPTMIRPNGIPHELKITVTRVR